MNIILLEKIKKLGDIGDEVKVRSGYARNFLVPNNKALYATSENRKYFEEIQIGDTVITDKHLVTLDNIEEFAELSGDKFYAHMNENSLEGTIFTERVAHGYFIMSKAAGLFVDPPKGPVLLNYGIDECRFTKPVYPGMTIGVRFTAKEKITQESSRSLEDIARQKKAVNDYSKRSLKP